MCLLFVYVNSNPLPDTYQVILVNNRDETFSRPTEPASIWNTHPRIVAGKDAMPGREGGTWLALSEKGQIGCLLNIFLSQEDLLASFDMASRGFLVSDFLLNDLSSSEHLDNLAKTGSAYAPFNLILLEKINKRYNLAYFNNKEFNATNLPAGCHGFGNSILSMPYQKVLNGNNEFANVVSNYNNLATEGLLLDSLFDLMKSEERYPDDAVINEIGKGYPLDYLHGLSSIKVKIPSVDYGTRTTSVILIDGMGRASFVERTMEDPSPACIHYITNHYQFQLPF